MSKYAVIVVDMIEDFVNGIKSCERGKAIVPFVATLCRAARSHDIPVIFSNDDHLKGIDKELETKGDHAISGTKGTLVIPELFPDREKDYWVLKRHFSGFFGTDLDVLLRDLGADTCIIAGLHTHACCMLTAVDAFQYGYNIVIPKETIDSFTEKDYIYGLEHIKSACGARICNLNELIAEF